MQHINALTLLSTHPAIPPINPPLPVIFTVKVDATYLSPHVNMAARLETASRQYGVPVLMSEKFYELMSDEGKEVSHHITSQHNTTQHNTLKHIPNNHMTQHLP